MKTIQFTISDKKHKDFKTLCTKTGRKMSDVCREFIDKMLEGVSLEDIVEQSGVVEEAYQAIELPNYAGQIIRLPIPNLVTDRGHELEIKVPGDTTNEDLERARAIKNYFSNI